MDTGNFMGTGKLITLDGIDGVGKSTQIQRLDQWLGSRGHETVCVRDPGSTEVGKRLRAILLDSDLQIHRRTEAMLFMASRCEMIETTIRPALEAGKTVISDRFLLANVVYQSVGGDVTAEQLWRVGNWANHGLTPDLTILLDMPASNSLARLEGTADRMEGRGEVYMESVRKAFLSELEHAGGKQVVISAQQSVDQIATQIQTACETILHDQQS